MSDLSKIKLNGTVYNFKDAVARTPYYGVCSTAKGTAQKTVTISNIETLTDGLSIFVKFTATNTAENPTLQINNLDPVAIKRYGTTAASTSAASAWQAGAVVQLVYDGTNFIMENWNNTTYSAMTEAEMQTGTATTARNITAARLKQAIEYHAPVLSVNGDTGAVTIDEIQTTAGENNVEYDLIGTAPANTNSGLVPLYKPTLVTFAKTTDYGRLTLGSSDTPGVLRIYSSTTNASGYTDLKTGSSSTNTRTITFPDATGTVALTSDIPSVSSWALAANKPSYTFSELTSHPTSLGGYGITDAYTKTEVDGLVSGVLHYKGTKTTVSALPSSGNTTGDTWHVTADGSEWAWDGSDWQELGTAVDLSGYVPTSRTVNGKALTSDISLTASDVSALPSSTTYVSSFNGESGAITYIPPVTSVNGQTGAVTITDSDEKVKYTPLSGSDTNIYGVLLAQNNGGTEATTTAYSGRLRFQPSEGKIFYYSSRGNRVGSLSYKNLNLTHDISSYGGTLQIDNLTASRIYTLPDQTGTIALTSDIPAADDHKWNDVALTKSVTTSTSDQFIPTLNGATATSANLIKALSGATTAYSLAQRDGNGYIVAATPASGDSSHRVATTEFVGTAIAAITASDVGAVPTVGGTLTGTLTVNANTNGKIVFQNNYADFDATTTLQQTTMTVQGEAMGYLLINGRAAINQTPTFDTAIVNKQYVDNKFSSISVPQPYNASTNPTGYLTINDLPIYDGTVI